MFGLGLWEWVGIFLLATLLFGPKFIVKTATSLWNSLTGFGKSFQAATAEPEALPEEPRALAAPKD
ncbi:twin-arginine translocase TatA/TatE family subunit [bacterium]|nr:twin-arginine translocase TatA/TatE family subunit [bacterium]